ncbi:MAG: NADH:flavin oxidoreductase [Syntrophobacteraceae bacterium]|nr:NADH:flavin oxidoreductase [Syntrophobacteraceae bacterium]
MRSKLFESSRVGNLVLGNRFVRSATWEGMATEDGAVTPPLVDLMVQLVKGGVGLIVTGHSYVCRQGQVGLRQMGAYADELLPGWIEMTSAVHQAGGRIVLQLAHGGIHATTSLTGMEAIGPSVLDHPRAPRCRSMSVEEIHETVKAFGQAALRARKGGFDGVQIHAAHGYLLSQFLSGFYNRRTDSYGGDIHNRGRFLREVVEEIRRIVGRDFPLLVKMNSEDFVPGGLTVDEAIQVARTLEELGVDAVELSGGTILSGKYTGVRRGVVSPEEEGYYRVAAKRCKESLGIPVLLVGGIRSFEVAEKFIEEGYADFISLCRPLIREPGIIARWRSGDTRRSDCLSDNLCFKPAARGQGIYCLTEEIQRKVSSRRERTVMKSRFSPEKTSIVRDRP